MNVDGRIGGDSDLSPRGAQVWLMNCLQSCLLAFHTLCTNAEKLVCSFCVTNWFWYVM